MLNEVVGFLVDGRFVCVSCTTEMTGQKIGVYRENIGIYSQQCNKCKTCVVEGVRKGNGDFLNLFELGEFSNVELENEAGYHSLFQMQYSKPIEKALKERDFEAAESIRRSMTIHFLNILKENLTSDIRGTLELVSAEYKKDYA